jgi:hypothetical protein
MVAAALQHLPPPLLGLILTYISDPESICNIAATCKDFRTATMEAALWKRLHRYRWQTCPSPSVSLTKADYEERHRLDASALKCIHGLQKSTNHLVLLYAVTHIMSSGRKILDSLLKVWQSDEQDQKARDTVRSLVHLLHYQSVCQSLMEVLASDQEEEHLKEDNDRRFEECAILTSKMIFHLDKDNILCNDDAEESQFIRAQLDEIAQTIQRQFRASPRNIMHHLEDKLFVVHKVLFSDMQFSASRNDDEEHDHMNDHDSHVECDNSLLHTALKRRRDINPLTLAILYKCICHRVGIRVEIVGLPGDNLLCLPDLNNRIVDINDHGRLLSFHDCELRFRAYRFPIRRR